MSLGLEYLTKVLRAPNYDTRRDMISDNLSTHHSFLSEALREPSHQSVYQYGVEYEDWLADEELRFSSDEQGPNWGWTWANMNKVTVDYFTADAGDWRKWAYVMWDRARLENSRASSILDRWYPERRRRERGC